MFQFERLHQRWIDPCARYLRELFGPAIEDKIFLDYAFGRGNWSLAALKAGAKRVIAIEASESNVRRFSDFCRGAEIDNVEIIHGNILQAPLRATADVLWIYGILSSVADPEALLSGLAEVRRDNTAVAVLYGYDRGSLRQAVVDAGRHGCLYRDERSFAADSFLFTPRARIRARDDLTAPVVFWFGATDFDELARRNSYVPRRWCTDFGGWLWPETLDEFAPHVAICGFTDDPVKPAASMSRPGSADTAVLTAVAQTVMTAAGPDIRRKIAIGLFNTHFSAFRGPKPAETALNEDFLYLMHAVLRLEIAAAAFQPNARDYVHAALAAITDAPRGLSPAAIAHSPLAAFLEVNTIRF
jgi:hypothetical protein